MSEELTLQLDCIICLQLATGELLSSEMRLCKELLVPKGTFYAAQACGVEVKWADLISPNAQKTYDALMTVIIASGKDTGPRLLRLLWRIAMSLPQELTLRLDCIICLQLATGELLSSEIVLSRKVLVPKGTFYAQSCRVQSCWVVDTIFAALICPNPQGKTYDERGHLVGTIAKCFTFK